jgi:cytochrome c biogenesis protein CcmG, thiol:disulfide interchange protein DsbE
MVVEIWLNPAELSVDWHLFFCKLLGIISHHIPLHCMQSFPYLTVTAHRRSDFRASMITIGAFLIVLTATSCMQRSDSARTDVKSPSAREATQEASSALDTDPAGSSTKVYVYALTDVAATTTGKRADFSWTENGKTVKLSNIAKGKPVFINFWATWCPPCRREIPDIVALHKEYGSKIVFLGIALENEGKAVQAAKLVEAYAQKNGIAYINIVGDQAVMEKLTTAYGSISSIPTTFVVDKNGAIIENIVGSTDKEGFLAALKKVM